MFIRDWVHYVDHRWVHNGWLFWLCPTCRKWWLEDWREARR